MFLPRHVKIGPRLLLSFLALAGILVFTGWLGARGVQRVHLELTEIFTTRYPSLDLLLQVDRDLHQLLVAERSMVFTDPADPIFAELVKEYDANFKQASDRWAKYKALSLRPEETALFRKYDENMERWREVSRKVVEARKAGSADPAIAALSLKDARTRFEEMRGVINELTDLNNDIAKAADASAGEQYRQTRRGVLGVTLVGFLAAVVLSVIITRSITLPLDRCVDFSDLVTKGRLDEPLDVRQRDELGRLADAMRGMVAHLKMKIVEADEKREEAAREADKARDAMRQADEARRMADAARREGMLAAAGRLQGVVQVVTSASDRMASQLDQSRQGAEVQAGRIAETATAMEEMNATVLEVARGAAQAAEISGEAKGMAEEGARVVDQVVQGIEDARNQAQALKSEMDGLGRKAESIGQVLNVISDIADQTNLLALNAAIEAARAGDAGRGFAVVADEVRKLAEKTMTATKEVGEAIRGIQEGASANINHVEKTVRIIMTATDLATASGQSLQRIVQLVERTSDQVRSIATASEEQSAASEEITRAIETINAISSETAQALGEAASSLSGLAAQARELKALIGEMQSEGGGRR